MNVFDPIILGSLTRPDVNLDYLPDFRRLTRSEVASRYRFHDARGQISGIASAGNRRQSEPHGAVFAHRVNSVDANFERNCIAIQSHFDALARQLFRFAFQ